MVQFGEGLFFRVVFFLVSGVVGFLAGLEEGFVSRVISHDDPFFYRVVGYAVVYRLGFRGSKVHWFYGHELGARVDYVPFVRGGF